MSASPRLGGDHTILTKEEEDAILQQLVDGDDQDGTSKKTWSRIVAEKYLMKVRSCEVTLCHVTLCRCHCHFHVMLCQGTVICLI